VVKDISREWPWNPLVAIKLLLILIPDQKKVLESFYFANVDYI
jgi:hypothetical protein